jgi:hypothetical protein
MKPTWPVLDDSGWHGGPRIHRPLDYTALDYTVRWIVADKARTRRPGQDAERSRRSREHLDEQTRYLPQRPSSRHRCRGPARVARSGWQAGVRISVPLTEDLGAAHRRRARFVDACAWPCGHRKASRSTRCTFVGAFRTYWPTTLLKQLPQSELMAPFSRRSFISRIWACGASLRTRSVAAANCLR